MNQKQRDFLAQKTNDNFKEQLDKLRGEIPKEPSLNNYLIAAILDGTIKYKDSDSLRNVIHKKVLDLGPTEALIKERDRYSRNNSQRLQTLELFAEDLFILPEAYIEAYKEYTQKVNDINDKMDKLRSIRNTIEIKIQIGSEKMLQQLIDQADNIGTLELMNDHLKLNE